MKNSQEFLNRKTLKELIENDELERFRLRAADEEEEFENFLINLVTQIVKLRMKKGITQKELAKKLGTKQSAISRLESMSTNPTLKFLFKVLKALDAEIKINDLTPKEEKFKIKVNDNILESVKNYKINPDDKIWEEELSA
ncbi:transcriptional regulator, XRE family protein [Thermosipho africanus H17ap60334]|jgi:transcriptional regulator with XRE-family HTH domain|uniref:transcriptional regulator n=1 Tax=Thermosipho africanus TaxID=2421 RepID=UPI00028CD2E5|nr:helix-turn-helix transcriptional regulator [Thermosipho africanus]EKF49497.1 transcriptional regulator, XRE family protein [Thermosipho africanus H17ap60334]